MDKKFAIMMAIPAIVVIGFLVFKLFTVTTGQEIMLEVVRPIDPTDLFRGNYVTLGYDISRLDLNETAPGQGFARDNTIYATLTKKEKFWTVDSVSDSQPSLNEDQACLKGKVTSSRNNQITVEWGIESFFSPLEQAKQIEKEKLKNNVSAVVAADSFCNSVIKALIVGDQIVATK